jgi:hypothetical protein
VTRITAKGAICCKGPQFYFVKFDDDKLFRVRSDLAWCIIPHIVEEFYRKVEKRSESMEDIFQKEMYHLHFLLDGTNLNHLI